MIEGGRLMKRQLLVCCVAAVVAASAFAAKPGGGTTRQLTYAGLPTITYVSDSDGRLANVSIAGKEAVSFDWSEQPYAVSVGFFGRWSINTSVLADGSATQQVLDAKGIERGTGTVLPHGRALGHQPMLLDALAADLGLARDWGAGQISTSPSDVELHTNGKTIIIKYRNVSPGVRVGESDGKALLWDLDLPIDATGRLEQVLPSRLIVTSLGTAHLAADSPVVGSVDGIWTNDPTGESVTFRKQLDSASSRADVRATSTTVHAEMRWICGMTEYWYLGWDGTSMYWENYYVPYYCDTNGGGSPPSPPDDGSGGTPPPPPPTDPEITQLQNQYATCPPTPAVNEFTTSATYTNPGHFTFDELRDSNYNHAIITPALSNGLETTRTNYGSAITVNAGYRSPTTNATTFGSATCGDHIRGTAADLNIRNATGSHDCAIWNALADAGHAAGAYVETWAELVRRGTPDHVHLDFGQPANDPSVYGRCNPTEVAP
jgi:hypothetical protein